MSDAAATDGTGAPTAPEAPTPTKPAATTTPEPQIAGDEITSVFEPGSSPAFIGYDFKTGAFHTPTA